MRPKQTRTKRRKKQREGTEAKKDRIKKQKKGDYNATLQPWREQTATVKVSFGPDYLFAHMSKRRNQPFMHMPTRSCRHVLCVLPICPHIDFPALPGMLFLPTSTWPALVAEAILCLTRSVSSVNLRQVD